ncbi:MAG: NAD(P)/FAD-dependent oxidoreductase [Sphingomonadaceae bacterium]|nr:NAD(P)/FAD-dependent oxidoreductase [Sphingomonadaceae bacterium]
MRSEGTGQYRELTDAYAEFDKDSFVEPGFSRDPVVEENDVVIIGAGLGGMMTAVRLAQAGIRNVRIIDRAGDFGGTWYWNRYPGCMCDVESYVYIPFLEETGFMPKDKYSKATEIFDQCQQIGRKFDLYSMALFQTETHETHWDEEEKRWNVTTDRGDRLKARFIVVAGGILHKAKLPGVPGIEKFQGASFHAARWNYELTGGSPTELPDKLADKRVAIIGTGATAVQVVPALAKVTKQVYVCQRTPSAVGVRNNEPTDPDWWKSLKPGWQEKRMDNFTAMTSGLPLEEDMVGDAWTEVYRGDLAFGGKDKVKMSPEERQLVDIEIMERVRGRIDEIVADKETAEALKPWYDVWCKRPCFHDDYLPAFNEPNVKLLDTDGQGPDEITEKGVVVQGTEYPVDFIVFATGFETGNLYSRRMGFELYGKGGVSLTEDWDNGASAHTLHGLLSRGFPNAFLYNSAQAAFSTSIVHTLYEHASHVAALVKLVLDKGATEIEPTPEAEEKWWEWVMTGLEYGYDQMKECTPSWLNGEGQRDPEKMKMMIYLGPLVHYSDKLREWREQGMPGLEIK